MISADFHINKKYGLLRRFFQKVFELYCRAVFRVYVPLDIEGREHLIKGPFILCSNHNSHMDSIVLIISSGCRFKNVGLVAATDYWFTDTLKSKVFRNLLSLIPVDRSRGIKKVVTKEQTFEISKSFIQHDHRKLLIYPEGTRSKNGDLKLPFKKGPALFAYELGIPLVPVYISGTFNVWPKGKFFMKPKRVSVKIGQAIYPNQEVFEHLHQRDVQRKEMLNAMTIVLQDAIIALQKGSLHQQQQLTNRCSINDRKKQTMGA